MIYSLGNERLEITIDIGIRSVCHSKELERNERRMFRYGNREEMWIILRCLTKIKRFSGSCKMGSVIFDERLFLVDKLEIVKGNREK